MFLNPDVRNHNTGFAQWIIKCWFTAKSGPNTQMAPQLVHQCCVDVSVHPVTHEVFIQPLLPGRNQGIYLVFYSLSSLMTAALQRWWRTTVDICHAGRTEPSSTCSWYWSVLSFVFDNHHVSSCTFFSSHSCFSLLKIRGRNLHIPSKTQCIFTS